VTLSQPVATTANLKPAPARRAAAVLAIVAMLAALGFLISFLVLDFPVAFVAVGILCIAFAGIWFVLTRRGLLRTIGAIVAVLSLAGIIAVLIWQDAVVEVVGFAVCIVLGAALVRYSQGTDPKTLERVSVAGEPAPRPGHPVLIMNPWSGGGKVEKFGLVEGAKQHGVEPILLERGLDLRELALDAVRQGADMLGMAGGDGSQAIVAQVAMEHRLPYVCIPAGTRNHLALDLGLDRADVAGALEAYTTGIARRIDLATINDHVFVNNVSLGIYAEIVQSDEYRDAKLKTAADMLPELLGPDAEPFDLGFDGPGGTTHETAQLILVSNNPYRLTTLFGVGSRPRMDTGELGIVALEVTTALQIENLVLAESLGRITRYSGWREWTAPTFEVRSGKPIKAGVDGEALSYDPPLRFASIPGALEVRIPPSAPGLSPAAATPVASGSLVRDLLRIAGGRPPSASGD